MNKVEVKDGKVYINEVEIENVVLFTMEPETTIAEAGSGNYIVSYDVNINFKAR